MAHEPGAGNSGAGDSGASDAPVVPRHRNDTPSYSMFPYRDGYHGYIQRGAPASKGQETRSIGGTLQVEGGYDFDQIYRAGFAVDLNWWRLGIKSDLSLLVEAPGGVAKDAMYLGSTAAHVAILMRPHLRWRVGGGAQYMIDGRVPGEGDRDYAAGGNFTTDVDVFPFWPMVLSGRFDIGTLYNARSVMARGTAGFVLAGFELYGGYTFRNVAGIVLSGPTVGLRAWF